MVIIEHLRFEILDLRFYMKVKHLMALGLLVMIASSCVTQKKMTYLQDASATQAETINAQFESKSEIIIRNGDAMTIFVTALDKEAVAPYNLPAVVFTAPGTTQVQTTPMLQYYIVDNEGNVEMPVLGKIRVAGMKRTEVEEHIKGLLEKQVLNPTVQVNLIGARVSVLGEVNRPGYVSINRDRMTILEALAAAGDLTVYGQRHNVLVTREVEGKIEMGRIDLRSTDLYASPYYYLQQNDVIYVSPNKVRVVNSANAGLWLSSISTIASAATVIVTVVNATKK